MLGEMALIVLGVLIALIVIGLLKFVIGGFVALYMHRKILKRYEKEGKL